MRNKMFFIVVLLTTLVASGSAQTVPTTVSFTARIVDGGVLLQGAHDFSFRLYDAATNGTQVWAEDHSGIEVEDGMVFLKLGSMTPLDAAVFTGAPIYLEVQVDRTPLSPRIELTSVPYAIRADTASKLGNLSPSDVVSTVTPGTGVTAAISGGDLAIGLADEGVTMSKVALPMGAPTERTCFPLSSCPNRALAAGTSDHFVGGSFTVSESGTCLVLMTGQIYSGAANTSNLPSFRPTIRVNNMNEEIPDDFPLINSPFYPTVPALPAAGYTPPFTVGRTFGVVAGQSIQFGCRFTNVTGDWVGDTAYCWISYICQ